MTMATLLTSLRSRFFVRPLFFVALLAALFNAPIAQGASDTVGAVKKADADRIAATLARDSAKLGTLLSEDLVYGQNEGAPLSKAQLLQSVKASPTVYSSLDYSDEKYTALGSDVVVMNGRATVKAMQGGRKIEYSVRVLAVWHNEGGSWKLVAYQSARLPDAGK